MNSLIKTYRVKKGLSKFELSIISGISIYRIDAFERKVLMPSFEEMEKIARALYVDTELLFGGRENSFFGDHWL